MSADPADTTAGVLLNASVLVFLFRSLAGARAQQSREEVSARLLGLLKMMVPFEAGAVPAGRTEEETCSEFRNRTAGILEDPEVVWRRLLTEGAFHNDSVAVVPLYVKGSLAGALVLRGVPAESMAALSAVASLASVAMESAHDIEQLRSVCEDLEHRLTRNGGILGDSPAIASLLAKVEKLAPRNTTVLIQGESGTGKELVARMLHRGSPRADAPFVAVNCAALPEALLETELFGHEKGAFTGAGAAKKGRVELSDGGTLFLDEVGELAVTLQAKLLRVLQERSFERVGGTRPVHVDLRVVAATNRDLAECVRNGSFRSDLFHRLNVVSLRTPALRDRKEDIGALANHFLEHFGAQCKRPGLRLSAEALRCLDMYDWPGNVRELENAIEHAVVLGEGTVVLPSDLPESLWNAAEADLLTAFQSSVTDAKRASILKAYQSSGGDYKRAAKLLGLHPNYLLRLVRTLGLREMLRK